mgnify:CR=1 FL=1
MRIKTIYRDYDGIWITRRRVSRPAQDLRVRPELWELTSEPLPLIAVGESLEVRA